MSGNRGADKAARRLEGIVGTVLRAGVVTSTACLAIGLAVALASDANGDGGIAGLLLHAGIIVLLATPVARVIVSIARYASERDWTFAGLTLLVLVELMASAVVALVLNRRS
jgi:uncharacterized membrane protein